MGAYDRMTVRSELPFRAAAFIGRERERAKVADLVAAARVVTLIGAGGCGKTRLAVAVVEDVAPRFRDGVRWVDLQGVSEPAMVAPAVGAAVGVHEVPGQALIATLAEQLNARHLLLVLDNCEQVVAACAELVACLSSACPQLHVLGTSRVPLIVDGEATFELAPLPVPEPDARSLSAVAVADAARLFEVRARQVTADFRINDDNASAVAEICRRLDGLPLAIELAAARVRVLAPGQIAAELSDRFGLLTGGVRGAPARQRTLEASVDWSYDLLTDAQRLALARLSVFAGSFELDAAKAIVGGGGIGADDVLDLVAALVEQSMVQVTQRHGSARYRLLETIRVYARQRLSELDAPERVRGRHLEFYVGLAGRAQEGLNGREPESWMARLLADLDELRAAMDWAAKSGDMRALVDLTEPIVRFWFDRGLSQEVHRRLHDAAHSERIPSEVDDRLRGLITAALVALSGGDMASAYRSASQAVVAARAADVASALALALGVRGQAGAVSGLSTSEQVDADVDEALEHAEQSGDAAVRAFVLPLSGWTLLRSRTIDAGCRLCEQGIEVCETAEVAFHLPGAHAILGLWPVWSGRLDQTRIHARRGFELARQVGRPGWEAVGFAGLGAADVLQGDQDRAKEWLSKAQSVLQGPGMEGTEYDMFVRPWLALSAYASRELDIAHATAVGIVRIGRHRASHWDESIGEWLLGVVAHAQGRRADARVHLEACRALSTGPRLPFPLGRSLLGLAMLAEEDDDIENAWKLAHDALEVLDDYDDRLGAVSVLEVIADLAAALGEPERALRLLAASQRFHAESGIVRFPLQTDLFERTRTTAQAALDRVEATACWDAGGALPLADAVAYARRGRGERRRPQFGWAALTPAERDVVRLVAQGHTNAEIGKRLFISVNTVKKHLSHVYEKVEVGGRADLAAQAARREQ